MEIHYMSRLEEKDFISDLVAYLNKIQDNTIEDDLYIGNGSSRIVLKTPSTIIEKYYKTWGLDLNREYVIKIAAGLGGKTQMDNEIEAYENYGELPLASIPAYGDFVEIMEKVERVDTSFYGDAGWYGFYYAKDLYKFFGEGREFGDVDKTAYSSQELCQIVFEKHPEMRAEADDFMARQDKISRAVEILDDYLGHTTDNEQLGSNADGDIVCYDYGFKGDNWGSSHTWSSPVTDNLYCDNNLISYLCAIADALTTRDYDYREIEEDWLIENGYESDYNELVSMESEEEEEDTSFFEENE